MPTALATVELISYHLCLAHRFGIFILTLWFGKTEWEQFDSELFLVKSYSVLPNHKVKIIIPTLYGFKPETGSDWLTALCLRDVVATTRALLQYSVFIGALCFSRGFIR